MDPLPTTIRRSRRKLAALCAIMVSTVISSGHITYGTVARHNEVLPIINSIMVSIDVHANSI